MASDHQFVEYVAEQLRPHGVVTFKKMFGEYMIYIDQKPIFLVCDNCVYIRMHDVLNGIINEAETGYPYPGAKLHYVIDIDETYLLDHIIPIVLPLISIKKRKSLQ